MKSKIVNQSIVEEVINWDKPQLLEYVNNKRENVQIIVLSSGKHCNTTFDATVLYYNKEEEELNNYDRNVGEHSNLFAKCYFQLVKGPLTIEFNNA